MNHSPIKIFIAYARKDAPYLQELRKFLHPLERRKTIQVWYDGVIAPGEKWEQNTKDELQAAQIILLLVSANSLYSPYFYDKEMKDALQRHKEGEAVVIPIIIDHCLWDVTELGELQALPKDGKAIEDWDRPALAYNNIVRNIYHQITLQKAEETFQQNHWIAAQKLYREAAKHHKTSKIEARLEELKKLLKLHPEIPKLLQDMVSIEGGSFQMGSENYTWAKPIRTVTIPSFKMAKYPVTQAQWQAVMGNNPSFFKNCDNCPVEDVSWNDCKEFIQKLNELTDKRFRLPSETEWEFAAKGGTKTKNYKFAGSNDIEEVAWYDENSNDKTHPVGRKKANELGLYDMSGNVWEWCEDDWHGTYDNAPNDGQAWVDKERGKERVLRGSSWTNYTYSCLLPFLQRSYGWLLRPLWFAFSRGLLTLCSLSLLPFYVERSETRFFSFVRSNVCEPIGAAKFSLG